MTCRNNYPILILALVSLVNSKSVFSDSLESITVNRQDCSQQSGICNSPYKFSDIEAFGNTFERHSDNSPSKVYLNRNLQLGPSNMRRRDILHFNMSGELIEIWSRYNRKINGLEVRSKSTYKVHPNGAIESIRLSFEQWINNKYYPDSANLKLDRAGNVIADDFYPHLSKNNPTAGARGIRFLETPLTISTTTFPVGTLIEVNAVGISRAHLFEKTEICGFTLGSESIGFRHYRDGSFAYVMQMKEDRMINGLPLKQTKESVVIFDDCTVQSAILASPVKINGFPLAAGERFKLGKSGNVVQGKLAEPMKHHRLLISAGTTVHYDTRFNAGLRLSGTGIVMDGKREYKAGFMIIDEHGCITHGILNKPNRIKGKTYRANTRLVFKPSGELAEDEML